MRQEPTDDLIVDLGLQGFGVEGVEVVAAARPGQASRRIDALTGALATARHCSAETTSSRTVTEVRDIRKTPASPAFQPERRRRFKNPRAD